MKKEKNKIIIEYIENTLNSSTLYTHRIFQWMNKEGSNLFDMRSVAKEFCQQGKIKPRKDRPMSDIEMDFEDDDYPLKNNFLVPCHEYKNMILCACQKERKNTKKDSQFEKKLLWLKDILDLNPCEFSILRLYAYIKRSHILACFLSDIFPNQRGFRSDFYIYDHPEVLGESESRIGRALSPNSHLRRSGIISMEERDLGLSKHIYEILKNSFTSQEEMKQYLVGQKQNGVIPLSEFQFLDNTPNFLQKLLKNAIQTKQKGINILLYGIPGTGKTEFAKSLSQAVGTSLYSICDGKAQTTEPNRAQRLSSLKISDYVLSKNKGILLFDEAEDVFKSDSFFSFSKSEPSKIFMNEFLENNIHPIIWTTNNIRSMDDAFLRRFTCLIPFEKPTEKIRAQIWKNAAQKNKLTLPNNEIQSLAETYQVPPAIITSVIKSTKLVDGGIPEAKKLLSLYSKAMNVNYEIKPTQNVATFDTTLLNTDTDMGKLAQQLCASKTRTFSLCLYGAAGTGKSAFARYIAKQLDMEVIEKKASDLFGMYVGQTEKNIADAFKEAKEKGAMLIFDEADSLLQDRSMAVRSWETTQVNEMLTWMESHPLPFVCTTNLMDKLDKASLRRFTFKVKYEFLSTDQVVQAFKHFFNLNIDKADVSSLTCLAPGDFVVVKKKADILGYLDNQRELLKMLSEEMTIKGEKPAPIKIGFV
ncbi:MAG: ATP-binding protein [Alphaproteobacteria bacterium]|nr:ATP-binding protein [Alphaproteobacteria bacterium]